MHPKRKTKIVCTIGPATESLENLTKLVEAGMNVMRLNFSHGDFAEHQPRVDHIRTIMKSTGTKVAILQDLAGPKIRIGTFKGGMATLVEGKTFTLTTDKVEGTERLVHVNYDMLPREVKPGGHILLHDGMKRLEVIKIEGNNIVTKIIRGGEIKDRRGVNVPGANLSIHALTPKDRKDLEFGLANKVDFFALSFVRRPSDITELRDILNAAGSTAGIIAKIETPEAIEHIDEIIKLCEGIMVARGDLAIEIDAEEVPLAQKLIIKKCNEAGKFVITATQMLESMIKHPIPTRAEVSDIANAVIDGTDAVMLSEETTLGHYPFAAVEVMARVALRMEKELHAASHTGRYHGSLAHTHGHARAVHPIHS